MSDTLSVAPFDGDTPENKTARKAADTESAVASNPATPCARVIL